MFGDNKSVVTNSSIPDSELKKRHIALSYHKTREAIAAGILTFHHISGVLNPADLLSKHWGFSEAWPRLQPILFCMGDTSVSGDGVAVKEEKNVSTCNDGECHAKGANPSASSDNVSEQSEVHFSFCQLAMRIERE
jgi:hypothetical protein